MKILKQFTLGAATLAIVLSATTMNVSAKTLKLAHAMPLEHPVSKSLAWFADEVTKRSNLRVKVYPNLTLGKEEATLQMVQNGTLAFTKVGGGLTATFSNQYKVLSLPYLYKTVEESKKILSGPIGDGILESSEKDGFIGLAFLSSGSRSFYSNTKIEKPADLKGLKIRVQNSPIDIDTMKALGASPVPISSGEVYSALQQSVVDGAENDIPTYFSTRHNEVAKYYSSDKHTSIPNVLAVSTDIWKTLSPENQKIIKEVAKESLAVQDKFWDEYVDMAKVKLVESGAEILTADIPAFQKSVQPVYEKFKKDNPSLVSLLETIQNAK